jgi:hypothetical protein
MNEIDYSLLPEHMQHSMRLYIEDGIIPGQFLCSVLENKLVEAFANADAINIARMFSYADFLYNRVPRDCWGSTENVMAWSKGRREEALGLESRTEQ